jgi:hypothetical protein
VRRVRISLIIVGVAAFLAISGLLARAFSLDGAERGAITSLVQAEAAGNTGYLLDNIQGCRADSACRARVAQNVAALRHPGSVTILQLNPSAGFSLTSTVGTARVAWEAGRSLPVVQCVRVRRAGNVLRGLRIQLLEISARIESDSVCPTSY